MTEAMREKMSARRVLAVLVGLLATILALQGLASVKPGGFEAFAQATSSPGGPVIKLINPDTTTSREISTKSDTVDTAYHFVAWVNQVPASASVQFKILPDGTNQREINLDCQETGGFTARFVSPDTFDCTSALAGVPQGGGTLRAILFSGTTSVSQDSETVTITGGQTVELTYPTQAGAMAFYTQPNGNSIGIVEFKTSAAVAPDDEGTKRVIVYYSTSPPGSEPAYRACSGTSAARAVTTTGGGPGSTRCVLRNDDPSTPANENDDPSAVTAIAVVALDVDEGTALPVDDAPDPDSADGHRAFGYEQDPTAVVVAPQTQRQDAGKCSAPVIATVLDQASPGRKVVGVNVDVHAQGPTDNLAFDDSGDQSSAHKPPEGHTTEGAQDCEATPPPVAGSQGKHDRVDSDVKHIEATDATGTDDNGQFKFLLYSANAGPTQFTVWADEDGNDQLCSEEAQGIGSIGWSQDPPSPTGTETEQTSCPKPTPGQTGTPTPAASNTTVRPTNTATATATATATSTGPNTSRTVTMSVDQSRVVAGRQVTFNGQILSSDASCTDNEFVQIRRRVLGTTSFEEILTTGTDSQGRFTFTRRVTESADYVAVAPAHDNCRESSSGEVTVLVKVKLQIIASDKTPNRGDRVRIKSSVVPQHDGTKLILQRKKGQRWVRVATDTLNRRSRAQFVIRANFGSRTFRTVWRSQDAEHESNKSRALTIQT